MKKLIFGLIATVFLGMGVNAQSSKVSPRKQICITVSCCGIGSFGIDIWSQTTCYWYDNSGKVTIKLNKEIKASEIELNEDTLLAGIKNENGEGLIMLKGKYPIVNNEIVFNAKATKPKVHCIGADYSGTIFGNSYSGGWSYCWTWIWDNKSNIGNLSITPTLNERDMEMLMSGSTEVTIDKDIHFEDNEINFTLKAGNYTLNQDGSIYLQNIKLKQ